ncbi:hypothetical protein TNCT_548751 [Trichonephila clavata]|uniref:C2H2-type domain-containing protein n=1 Tax=Trichonephila clavata TaxID=2740835 RepID=A0A8X6I1E8_TRICU|nr:hypothetical protein TNCT_548751 [Trichonephila clavata]
MKLLHFRSSRHMKNDSRGIKSLQHRERNWKKAFICARTDPPLPTPQSALHSVMESSSETLQKYYCNICKKQCTSSESYDLHVLSKTHCMKVLMVEMGVKLANVNASGMGSSSNSIETNSYSKAVQRPTTDEIDSINTPKSFEYTSDIPPPFPSPEASDQQQNVNDPQLLPVENAYHKEDQDAWITETHQERYKICVLCDKIFKGPIAYEEHLQGISHKQRTFLRNVGASTFHNSVGYNTGAVPKYYCTTCKKQCAGRREYGEHILSNFHLKQKRNTEVNNIK